MPDHTFTDADRYRWMRMAWLEGVEDDTDPVEQQAIGLVQDEAELDAAIDAELRKPENAHLLQSCRAGDGKTPTLSDGQINRLISRHEVHEYHPGALLEFSRAVLQASTPPTPAEIEIPDYAVEINRLRNVIQAACTGGLDHMIECWKVLFPDAPVPSVNAPDALGYATRLAESMFSKHFASDPHYASGEVVWGPCDNLMGVLTQIDNMAAGLTRKAAAPAAAPAVTDEMRSAVRWAPSSAYWSERLREFFGPDAREGIDLLERRLSSTTVAVQMGHADSPGLPAGDLLAAANVLRNHGHLDLAERLERKHEAELACFLSPATADGSQP